MKAEARPTFAKTFSRSSLTKAGGFIYQIISTFPYSSNGTGKRLDALFRGIFHHIGKPRGPVEVTKKNYPSNHGWRKSQKEGCYSVSYRKCATTFCLKMYLHLEEGLKQSHGWDSLVEPWETKEPDFILEALETS